MKKNWLLFLIFIISCHKGQLDNQKIKSITKTINEINLEIQEFDLNGKLVFKYYNQIDFGKENSIISISAFEYDSINNKVITYHANSRSSMDLTVDSYDLNSSLRKKEIGIFDEIIDKELYKGSLMKSNSKVKFIDFFKSNYPSNLPFKYTYEYSDTIKIQVIETIKNDTLIVETTKEQDRYKREYSKVYFNSEKKKIKEFIQGEYNRLIENIYDDKERLVLQYEAGQHYKFYYDGSLLIKKEMYHGDDLAFKEEYIYENDILIKEIKHRLTESKYFLKIPKIQTVLYHYEYY